SNVKGAQDANDLIDGGAGFDVIAGDNALVYRRDDSLSPRFINLNQPTIYDTWGTINSGETLPDPRPWIVPADQIDPKGLLHRDTTLFAHSNSPLPGTSGSDTIAGGAGDDEIYGELGNDIIQGDGSIVLTPTDATHPNGPWANVVGASSDP